MRPEVGELVPAVRASLARAWDELARAGRLHPAARPADGELPATFAEVLADAIAAGGPDGEDARRHYLETMPRARVAQLATVAEPNATLFHHPLDAARLPRLRAAADRFDALLDASGVPPGARGPLADDAWQRLRRGGRVTVAELYQPTHYAGFMPLLYGAPADLARAARAMPRLGSVEAVVDAHLTAPLVHELSHLGRRRAALLPLHLDECVAGYLGVRAHRAFAFPGPGDEDAIYATPRFSQIGQALVRVAGLVPVVRAHAGVAAWDDVLPGGLAAAARSLGARELDERRSLHFLSDVTRPERWHKLFFLAAAGRPLPARLEDLDAVAWRDIPPPPPDPLDDEIIADGLASLALRHELDGGAHVVRVGPPASATPDLDACQLRAGEETYLYPPTRAAAERVL